MSSKDNAPSGDGRIGKSSPKPLASGFLGSAGIQDGDWLKASKPEIRQLLWPNNPIKTQLYGFFLLHSPGFQSEKALTRSKGVNVPITSADIVAELHRAP